MGIELENAELAKIISVGYDHPDKLSPEEWYRFSQYRIIAINAWEYYFKEHEKEAIPEQLWVGANAYIDERLSAAGMIASRGTAPVALAQYE